MKYVIGVDLGTSAVKVLLVNQSGHVVQEVSKSYPLIQEKSGYSEQDPNEWFEKTTEALAELVAQFNGHPSDIEGISFSGQMHGLVILDQNNELLRNAILWNDTRTTEQCQQIYDIVAKDKLLSITKNVALEGFTLPKILWVKQYEPDIFQQIHTFMLPKDYLRFRMTGEIHMDYSDAAGTLLLDIAKKEWSKEICEKLDIHPSICPPLVESSDLVGTITREFAEKTGLSEKTKVFAGGADNACGAIGAGILSNGKTLCSIGTSGVVLSYEETNDRDFKGKVHYFNHGKESAYYTMGVTLAAGYSLSWFKDVFASYESFNDFLAGIENVPAGSNGLLFTPYIVGERTPHPDSNIRGSFIGMDAKHTKAHFVRAVIEGITFSLNESIEIFRASGKTIDTIVSIGGGAKNETWLQIQADIFHAKIIKLASEQGPGMGAAMLAAYGCGWFDSLDECAETFLDQVRVYEPISENVTKYKELFKIYQEIYVNTKNMNEQLKGFRA
ncbi:xylulokinase [Bacillus andreraoultii]|uniref:xylulokinase n=1 Tax=Bacillus andreraoultii TaxID=1499685 RepID=UPI00053BAECE|nr:xylulokinase [Bacillus andreraoultii]